MFSNRSDRPNKSRTFSEEFDIQIDKTQENDGGNGGWRKPPGTNTGKDRQEPSFYLFRM